MSTVTEEGVGFRSRRANDRLGACLWKPSGGHSESNQGHGRDAPQHGLPLSESSVTKNPSAVFITL